MRGRRDDKSLGMDRRIDRRDFLQGAAVALGAIGTGVGARAQGAPTLWPQDLGGYDPPALTGMRGSHPGSFENAHRLRDGDLWAAEGPATALDETYDLIVVGGGISGLSAAHFYRQAKPEARILILDNHDDFGGHAKRNEFQMGGRLHLMNGGTLEIDSPRPYSAVADGLLKTLGIDPPALSRSCDHNEVFQGLGLGHGVFFDRETFGADALVTGAPNRYAGTGGSWPDFAARTPLPAAARDDLVRIETGEADYMPGLTSAEKKDALSRISYRDYLAKVAKVHPLVLAFYQTHTQGEWGIGIDAVSALDCWGFFMPGFRGLKLDPGPAPRMSFTPAGYSQGGSYTFHFPDGNATIARLLVRDLAPAAVPGSDCRDVVTARVDYSQLDRPQNAVRIRLASLCVGVRNLGPPSRPDGVEVAYIRGDSAFRLRARACVLASWNMMIPYLCPELPPAQKAALHRIVKTPLVYTTVALRDWTAFRTLGVSSVSAPGGYHTGFRLNAPVDIGAYSSVRSPDEPILVSMTRTPCKPGLPEHEQNKAGRAELLATPFETFEREIRAQLGRTLQAGGFDPARDITAITVNRWPHGYAPEWNPLWGQVYAPGEAPNEIGRAPFGAIFIANADAGAAAYTDCAIDQAYRAVQELLTT